MDDGVVYVRKNTNRTLGRRDMVPVCLETTSNEGEFLSVNQLKLMDTIKLNIKTMVQSSMLKS